MYTNHPKKLSKLSSEKKKLPQTQRAGDSQGMNSPLLLEKCIQITTKNYQNYLLKKKIASDSAGGG